MCLSMTAPGWCSAVGEGVHRVATAGMSSLRQQAYLGAAGPYESLPKAQAVAGANRCRHHLVAVRDKL